MSQVKVSVSGSNFQFSREILQARPFQKLPQIVSDAVKQGRPLEFSFDRPSEIFTYILSYYETGELHMPTCVCPSFFEKELRFWEIDPEELAECCYYRYTRFLNDLETQTKFKKETMTTGNAKLPMVTVTSPGGLTGFRQKIWRIVDSNTDTAAEKIYFGLVIFMVLLCVGTLAFSTEPSMRRKLNKCELIEYLEYTKHAHKDFIVTALGNPSCSGDARSSSIGEFNINEYDWHSLWDYYYQQYMYEQEYDKDGYGGTTTTEASSAETPENSTASDYYDIDPSEIANALEFLKRRHGVTIPQRTVPLYIFDVLERITMAFFTIDLFIRLFSCPSLKKYFLSFLNVVDACALISSYIYVIVLSIKRQYRYEETWIRTLEFLQIFRVFRLFRVVQNVRATKVLVYSMWQNIRDITLLAFLLFMAISLFSTVLYFAEEKKAVESIPEAWYWAVVTLTTVGYGDIAPKSYPGRFVASLCAVCGVILLAVTLPIFVNNFLVLYDFSCVQEANENRKLTRSSKTSGYVRDVSIDEMSTPSPPPSGDKKKTIFYVVPKVKDLDNIQESKMSETMHQ